MKHSAATLYQKEGTKKVLASLISILVGLLVGEIVQEAVHERLHRRYEHGHEAGKGRGWLAVRRREHGFHHAQDARRAFGTLSGFWDRVLGSAPPG